MTFLTKVSDWFKTEEKLLEDILGVFTKTEAKLNEYLDSLEEKLLDQELVIVEANNEMKRLSGIRAKSAVILSKFQSLIGDS